MNDNMIDVTSLPFVTKSSNGSRHRFWTPVRPSSDWFEDEQKGFEFALAYLSFEITNGAGPILSLILNDMIEVGDRGTVAKSFYPTGADTQRHFGRGENRPGLISPGIRGPLQS